MTTIDGNVRLMRHVVDLDDDGHDTAAGGMAPNIIVCELNSPPTGDAQTWDWDTFYDKDSNDITGSITAALAAIGLTYSGGVFTSTEDGTWLLRVAFSVRTAPSTQINSVTMVTFLYEVSEWFVWNASTQLLTPPNFLGSGVFKSVTQHVYMNSGDAFSVRQDIDNLSDSAVANYATMSIIRLQ